MPISLYDYFLIYFLIVQNEKVHLEIIFENWQISYFRWFILISNTPF